MPRTLPYPKSPADVERMLGNGPKGIAIIWSYEVRHEVMYCATKVNPKLDWKDLPLLSKLGVHNIQYTKPDPKDKGGVPDIIDTRNITLELFTMDCDPVSPTFGTPGYAARGTVLLRLGGEKSTMMVAKCIIEPLELFIEERLAAIKSALPDQDAANKEYEQLSPKAFKQFFKNYRAEQAKKYIGLCWEETACPVEFDSVACEGCGVDEVFAEGATASNLKKCGRCKGVQDCTKVCQAENWKAHKPFCKSAKK